MLPKLPRLRARISQRTGIPSYFFDHGGEPRRWERLLGNDEAVLRRYKDLIGATAAPAFSVDRMLGDYLELARAAVAKDDLAKGTYLNYCAYRKHLAAVFDPDPRETTQADVLHYLRACPRMTFRGEIGLLSMAFSNWMELGKLNFNPCFGVRIKRKASKRTRLLLPAEITAIVAKADERLSVAIELAYATGLRIGDLCALRWATLDGVVETQKTGARQAIEGSDALSVILARARVLQARIAGLYVLCDRRGRPWKTGTLRKRWNGACTAAAVANAHFHDIRAAAGTEFARLYGREAAREFLGHADVRTTLLYLRGLQVGVIRPLARKA